MHEMTDSSEFDTGGRKEGLKMNRHRGNVMRRSTPKKKPHEIKHCGAFKVIAH